MAVTVKFEENSIEAKIEEISGKRLIPNYADIAGIKLITSEIVRNEKLLPGYTNRPELYDMHKEFISGLEVALRYLGYGDHIDELKSLFQ